MPKQKYISSIAFTLGIILLATFTNSVSGAIDGKLVAIKDNICTSDLPTTAASGILRSFTSPYDATVVQKLRAAGAILAGKTNLDEFGMGSHSRYSYFGRVQQNGREPGKPLSTGGSSGGSAVAVATSQCWAALGTDTGGSVRLPAAYTGIVGFKPSYGHISRWGVIAYAHSLDTVGVFAHNIDDVRALFDVIGGHDSRDPTSLSSHTRSRITDAVTRREYNPASLRIGVPLEYNIAELHPSVRSLWARTLSHFQASGHSVIPVSLPSTRHSLSAYYVLAPAEASSNLAKYDGVRYGSRILGPDGSLRTPLYTRTRGVGFGDEVRRRVLLGTYSLSAEAIGNYFLQAQRVRRLVQWDFDRVFGLQNPLLNGGEEETHKRTHARVDVLVCPTAPTPPPALEDVEGESPVDAYTNDVFTVPASLAGLPSVSVPVKSEAEGSSVNVGMQVIGQFGDDSLVLEAAKLMQDQD